MTATPPPTSAGPSTPHPSVIVTSREEQTAKLLVPAVQTTGSSSPRLAAINTIVATAASAAASPPKNSPSLVQKSGVRSSASNIGIPTDSKDSGVVTPSSMSNQQQRGSDQLLDRQRAIANEFISQKVLEKSKILKVCSGTLLFPSKSMFISDDRRVISPNCLCGVAHSLNLQYTSSLMLVICNDPSFSLSYFQLWGCSRWYGIVQMCMYVSRCSNVGWDNH